VAQVNQTFNRYLPGFVERENVVFVEGYVRHSMPVFNQSLPAEEDIAVLRIDVDMYEGYCIIINSMICIDYNPVKWYFT
jgi:hypothetical protein